jgi:ketosteroid isomerase-like protein
MKSLFYFVFLTGIITFAGCQPKPPKVDFEKEREAIKLVLEKYALANENQNMDFIEEIWSPSESIVSFGTEGDEKLVGFSEIKSAIQKQFDTFTNTYISYRDQIIEINETGNTAWFSEIVNYNFILDGKAHTFEGLRYTGVLVKKDGKWKLVQTHMSVPYTPEND